MFQSVRMLEVCVESVESAISAEKGGAHRVELCSDLSQGGLTPSYGLIQLVQKSIQIPIHVLIRPRSGNFLYSEMEFKTMCADIESIKAIGIQGIVIGVLKRNGKFDFDRITHLCEIAKPMSVTLHRCIDVGTFDHDDLLKLLETPISTILSSGSATFALDGCEQLAKMIGVVCEYNAQSPQNKPKTLMIGSGVSMETLPAIWSHLETLVGKPLPNCIAVHGSFREFSSSEMEALPTSCVLDSSDGRIGYTSVRIVQRIVAWLEKHTDLITLT